MVIPSMIPYCQFYWTKFSGQINNNYKLFGNLFLLPSYHSCFPPSLHVVTIWIFLWQYTVHLVWFSILLMMNQIEIPISNTNYTKPNECTIFVCWIIDIFCTHPIHIIFSTLYSSSQASTQIYLIYMHENLQPSQILLNWIIAIISKSTRLLFYWYIFPNQIVRSPFACCALMNHNC